jgi:hypothetical protein
VALSQRAADVITDAGHGAESAIRERQGDLGAADGELSQRFSLQLVDVTELVPLGRAARGRHFDPAERVTATSTVIAERFMQASLGARTFSPDSARVAISLAC